MGGTAPKPGRAIARGILVVQDAAELKGPDNFLRIRPEIDDFEPDLGQKLGQTKPKKLARHPQTGRQRFRTVMSRFRCLSTTIRNLNCERSQPRRPGAV